MTDAVESRAGRPEPGQLQLAVWMAVLLEAIVLLYVARTFYLQDHQSGLPLAPLLCVVSTAGFMYIVFLIDVVVHRSPKSTASARTGWTWVVMLSLFTVGAGLPMWLAKHQPIAVLQWIPTAAGAVVIAAPGVVVVLIFAYRAYQSRGYSS